MKIFVPETPHTNMREFSHAVDELGLFRPPETGPLRQHMPLKLTYENYFDRCRDIRADLEAQLHTAKAAGYRSVIISSENLSALATPDNTDTDEPAKLLRRFLAPYCSKITVIVTLRRQDLWSISRYRNSVKGGHAGDPNCLVHEATMQYDHALKLWESAFGMDSVYPVIFPDSAVDKVGIIQSYCQLAELMDLYRPEHEVTFRENTATDSRAVEAIRLLNIAVEKQVGSALQLTTLRKRVEALLDREVFDGPLQKALPERGHAEIFVAEYAQGNEAVRKRHFPHQSTLFHDDFSNYPEQTQVPAPDMQDLIRRVALLVVDKKLEDALMRK